MHSRKDKQQMALPGSYCQELQTSFNLKLSSNHICFSLLNLWLLQCHQKGGRFSEQRSDIELDGENCNCLGRKWPLLIPVSANYLYFNNENGRVENANLIKGCFLSGFGFLNGVFLFQTSEVVTVIRTDSLEEKKKKQKQNLTRAVAKGSKVQVSLVELGHIYLDVAKVGPLCGVLGPAALHQDGQLFWVASVVGGGPKEGLLTVPHLLDNLCSDESRKGGWRDQNAIRNNKMCNKLDRKECTSSVDTRVWILISQRRLPDNYFLIIHAPI